MSQKTEHNRKKHLSRKMLKGPEIKNKATLFSGHDWSERAKKKQKKQEKLRDRR